MNAAQSSTEQLVAFPEGRRRFIRWVKHFGVRRLARELWRAKGEDRLPEPEASRRLESTRLLVYAWVNTSAKRLIRPSRFHTAQIVRLSIEHPLRGDALLTRKDLREGTAESDEPFLKKS